MDIKQIADNYEREYGFMAVNATLQNARMFLRVHDEVSVRELEAVHNELVRRGHKVIRTEQEYKDGVAAHGVPRAFSAA